MNNKPGQPIYEFGEFRLDAREHLLWHGAEQVALTHKAIELLTLLIERRGQTVTKNEILDALWHDTFVDENNLAVTVSMLRKAFGEKSWDKKYIETVPKRGYRFVADVQETNGDLLFEKQSVTRITIEEKEENLELKRGLRRHSIALVVIAALVVCLGLFLVYSFWHSSRNEKKSAQTNTPRTIAVLPLKNLGGNGDESLSIGLTDALITKLGNVRGLVVRPTGAVLPFASNQETPQAIGEKLNVEVILEGTIQSDGERVRVSLQLVRVKDNQILWAGNFDERTEDLFKFQDAFTANIADALIPKISNEEQAMLVKRDTENPEAYRQYLKGRYYWSKRTPDALKRAAQIFEQAANLDANYAQAFAAAGSCYYLLGSSEFAALPPAEAYNKAREFVVKALGMNPNLAEAHLVLGGVRENFEWNLTGAEQSFLRAIELAPNNATAHHWLAWCLLASSRFDEAAAEFRRARELDPTSLIIASESGYPAFFAEDYETAIRQFAQALETDKDFPPARITLWRALHNAKRYDEALTQLTALEPLVGSDFPLLLTARGQTLAAMGKIDGARQILTALVSRKQKGEYISPLFLAMLSAELDDRDATFHWLEECFAERNDYLLFLPIAPEFQKVRDDERFKDLRRRVKQEN